MFVYNFWVLQAGVAVLHLMAVLENPKNDVKF